MILWYQHFIRSHFRSHQNLKILIENQDIIIRDLLKVLNTEERLLKAIINLNSLEWEERIKQGILQTLAHIETAKNIKYRAELRLKERKNQINKLSASF